VRTVLIGSYLDGVMCCDEVTDEGYESPDEVPLGLRREMVENLYCKFDYHYVV
jgi:hypothetical protein